MAQAVTATIWLANLDGLPGTFVPEWAATLSDGERQRYRAFIRESRQRQFVAGRMMLRRAVSMVAGVPADSIAVEEQLGKPPVLTLGNGKRAPYFSISHSGQWVACAVSLDSPLGLDVEVPDPERDIAALAAQAFGPAEARRLMELPASAQLAEFYDLWCRAEARYKLGQDAQCCHGVGHAEVAIALCGARVLSEPPSLRVIESLAEFVGG